MKIKVIHIAKTHQIVIPHHVVNGIKSTEKQVADNAKIRDINIMIVKYPQLIVESPAKKHKISSGNKGNKNINDKNKLSLPFNFFCHLSNFSFPTIHETALFPNFRPIKNAKNEPSIIPRKLYINVFTAPKSAMPAMVLTILGIGKTITCQNCNKI